MASGGNNDSTVLGDLTRQLFGVYFESLSSVVSHASPRRRYRIHTKERSVIGVINEFRDENDAFVYLAQTFRAENLPVPEVYIYNSQRGAWLEEDLGNSTLFDFIKQNPQQREKLYKQALENLVLFQVVGGQKVDFTKCLDNGAPSKSFYEDIFRAFREDFIQRVGIEFNPIRFESECARFLSLLDSEPAPYFLYKDFQSRNIMVQERGLSFIDFQSGRQGHLQYDLVSLLYQVSTSIPDTERESLIAHYLNSLKTIVPVDEDKFHAELPLYIAARMMQVLSVYGRQGLGLKKEYFLNNIALALPQLKNTITKNAFGKSMPEMTNIVEKLMEHHLR